MLFGNSELLNNVTLKIEQMLFCLPVAHDLLANLIFLKTPYIRPRDRQNLTFLKQE